MLPDTHTVTVSFQRSQPRVCSCFSATIEMHTFVCLYICILGRSWDVPQVGGQRGVFSANPGEITLSKFVSTLSLLTLHGRRLGPLFALEWPQVAGLSALSGGEVQDSIGYMCLCLFLHPVVTSCNKCIHVKYSFTSTDVLRKKTRVCTPKARDVKQLKLNLFVGIFLFVFKFLL